MFSIYYSDRVVHGCTARDWRDVPDHDVQVVVEWRRPSPEAGELKYVGVFDRVLHTGEDEYDPFGWGVKFGKWMVWDAYQAVWERAAHGCC